MSKVITFGALGLLLAGPGLPALAGAAPDSIEKVVSDIKRADYKGDRPALEALYQKLEPFLTGKVSPSRVRYWRGFAMWREAVNGFNDAVTPTILGDELTLAVSEFDQAIALDRDFVDAKIAEASCLMSLTYINLSAPDKVKELVTRFVQLLKESQAEAPENPRFYWVNGAGLWFSPAAGGGQDAAIAGYEKGLNVCRRRKDRPRGSLDPTWGEPELLMSLAWSNLNRRTPDVSAAEGYAKQALKLVPYWHYVRDILLPQIIRAKKA